MSDVERCDALLRTFPESELGRRLLRRGSAFIGVIDLRRTFVLHSRASLPALARLGLLRQLKRRYGQDQGIESATGMVFRESVIEPPPASFPMGAVGPSDMASSAPQNSRSSPEANATRPPQDPTADQAMTKLRVKRPDASHARREPYMPAAGAAAPETHGGGEPLLARREEAEARPSSGLFAPEPIDPIQRTETAAAGTAAREASSDSLRAPPAEQKMQSDGSVRHDPPPLIFARHAVLAQQATRADGRPDLMMTLASRAALPTSHAVARPSTEVPRASLSASGDREDEGGSSTSNLVLRAAPPTERAIPEAARLAVDATSNAFSGAPSGRPAPSPAIVTEEIRANPIPDASPAIVWRSAHHGRESRDAIPPSVIDRAASVQGRQTLSLAGAQTDFGERPSPLSTPYAAVGSVDVTNIARQVSRAIARQLRVDRERRGRTR